MKSPIQGNSGDWRPSESRPFSNSQEGYGPETGPLRKAKCSPKSGVNSRSWEVNGEKCQVSHNILKRNPFMKYIVILNEELGFTLTFNVNCFLISAVRICLRQLGDPDTTLPLCPILLTSLTTLLSSRLRNRPGYEIKSRTSNLCERAQKKQVIRAELRNCISHSNAHVQLPMHQHIHKFNLSVVIK